MKHILFIAWEYPGLNSIQGQALCRRISQLRDGFLNLGFKITFIHPDHRNELSTDPFNIIIENEQLTRVCTHSYRSVPNNPIIRKAKTIFDVTFLGDYTGHWAKNVGNDIIDKKIKIDQPDCILSFYTPRGPILLGTILKQHFSCRLVSDIQDPFHEGIGKKGLLYALNKKWSKKFWSKSDLLVFVNSFWAEEFQKIAKSPYAVLNHAVPEYNYSFDTSEKEECVYYAGSLYTDVQDIRPFLLALEEYSKINSKFFLKLSVNESIEKYIRRLISELNLKNIRIKSTGWLSQKDLHENIATSKILLIVPWHDMGRMGIPSKFFELIYFKRPILVAGKDSGGFKKLFEDYKCPICIYESPEEIAKALNNIDLMFSTLSCENKPITESELAFEYSKLL